MNQILLALLLGIFRMVVIPAEFSDRAFVREYEEMKADVLQAQQYFNDQLHGKDSLLLEFAPIVRLSEKTAYYGTNYTDRKDILLHEGVMEACRLSDGETDFADTDAVILIAAGMSEADGAGAELIWPQYARLSDYSKGLKLDGQDLDKFAVATELSSEEGKDPTPAGIRILCHEIAHAIGLHDMYDTDGEGSGGLSEGLRGTSLMGSIEGKGHGLPPNFSALDLEILGRGDCDTLSIGRHTLSPIHKEQRYIKMLSDTEGEFFLFECRSNEGWDRDLGGKGLLIYHVDMSASDAGYSDYYGRNMSAAERWEKAQINANPAHQCAYIVAAVPESNRSEDIFFPRPGHDSFGSDTRPAFRFWNGNTSNIAISEIRLESDGSISFTASEPIRISSTAIFQDAAIIQWETAENFKNILGYEIEWTDGTDTWTDSINAGRSSYTISGLTPQKHYVFKLTLKASEENRYSIKDAFITKYYRNDTYPYIYLSSAERNPDGSFVAGSKIPLRIFNAPGIHEVKWYFNNKPIEAEADGYYTIRSSGRLKAEISYKDGYSEVIIKDIRL